MPDAAEDVQATLAAARRGASLLDRLAQITGAREPALEPTDLPTLLSDLAVLRADPPLELWAVLDEAVLRRRVGGPGVMAAQLSHLVELGSLPHVHLQVLPHDILDIGTGIAQENPEY